MRRPARRAGGTARHETVARRVRAGTISVVLYIGGFEIPGSDDHEGYVSARTPEGADTGIWTDLRCGGGHDGTYTAFRAACECGWRSDRAWPPDRDGYRAALRWFVHRHFVPWGGRGGLDPARDFLVPWGAPAPA